MKIPRKQALAALSIVDSTVGVSYIYARMEIPTFSILEETR
jgi:hypothetical protein